MGERNAVELAAAATTKKGAKNDNESNINNHRKMRDALRCPAICSQIRSQVIEWGAMRRPLAQLSHHWTYHDTAPSQVNIRAPYPQQLSLGSKMYSFTIIHMFLIVPLHLGEPLVGIAIVSFPCCVFSFSCQKLRMKWAKSTRNHPKPAL